jgi:hypothetical protein
MRIIGDPVKQRPVKWGRTVLKFKVFVYFICYLTARCSTDGRYVNSDVIKKCIEEKNMAIVLVQDTHNSQGRF